MRCLHNVLVPLFLGRNANILRDGKMAFFTDRGMLRNWVLPCVHLYFERLKPLLEEWWDILYTAYNSFDDVTMDTIHDQVLDMLNKNMKKLEDTAKPDKETEAEKIYATMENERRQKDFNDRVANLQKEPGVGYLSILPTKCTTHPPPPATFPPRNRGCVVLTPASIVTRTTSTSRPPTS